MTVYAYNAIDDAGNRVSGEIDAESPDSARHLLAGRGLIPESVSRAGAGRDKPGSLSGLFTGRVKAMDLVLYTKQFRTLLRAGVPILQIFKVMESQTQSQALRRVTVRMAGDIQQGSSLYQAFACHGKIFSRLYCTMIRAGEESGSLPDVLERLIYIIEHEEKVRNDIKSAVRYPVIVLAFLGVAFFVLLTFVVPKFAAIFQGAGLDLPLPTRVCMALQAFLSQNWPWLLLGLAAGAAGLMQFAKTGRGRLILHRILLNLPVLGPLFVKSAMSRFSAIFSILQSSGITVLESMGILRQTIGNAAVTRELEKIGARMEEGRGIADPLSRARYFPPMVINMVAVGEESGNLDDMLREIAVHYDAEVAYATKGLSEALGPILMIGLSAVVGFFAFAIFLPMWDLTKMV